MAPNDNDPENLVKPSSDRAPPDLSVEIGGQLLRGEVTQRTYQPQQIAAAVMRLSANLAFSTYLREQLPGSQRLQVLYTVRGLLDFLRFLDVPAEQEEPLLHVFDALMDLEDGILDPLFKPDGGQSNREPTSIWLVKASVAGAMNALMRDWQGRRGLGRHLAATQVAKKLPELARFARKKVTQQTTPATMIIEWREAFEEYRAPEGKPRATYDWLKKLLDAGHAPAEVSLIGIGFAELAIERTTRSSD